MAEEIGRNRFARRTYGFDEVALAPGALTIDPELADVSWQLGGLTLPLPILGASLDALVDPKFAISLGKLGGLAVMYLEGIQAKYDDPQAVIDQIITAEPENVVSLIQEIYRAPIRDDLILKRIAQVKEAGVPCAVGVGAAVGTGPRSRSTCVVNRYEFLSRGSQVTAPAGREALGLSLPPHEMAATRRPPNITRTDRRIRGIFLLWHLTVIFRRG
jgi:hypothetical protein